MPQIGWDIDGMIYTLEEVRERADAGEWAGNRWPIQVLEQMRESPRNWRRLRASTLGRCIRAEVLKRHEDYVLRPDDCWPLIIGSGFHRLMDGASTSRILREVRMSVEIPVLGEILTLSGQIDYYDRQTRILDDYKLTGSVYTKRTLSWSYALQQNVYVHLLREQGEEPERARLWYAETKPIKPQGSVQKLVKIKSFEVPIWSREQLQETVTEIAQDVVRAHRDGYLPSRYTEDDEQAYQCRTCPVNRVCHDLMQKGI